MTKNYSIKNDYYSQVNNKKFPLTSCKNTSVIMALNQAGYTLEVKQLELNELAEHCQPEDILTHLAYLRGYRVFAQKHAPWFFNDDKPKVPLHEIPQITVKIVNDIIGANTARLIENYSVSDIISKLNNGHGLAALGKIVTPGGKTYNHVVSIAGYEYSEDHKLINIIIDDPFGAYDTNYNYRCGNDVKMPIARFTEFFLADKYKWIIDIKGAR